MFYGQNACHPPNCGSVSRLLFPTVFSVRGYRKTLNEHFKKALIVNHGAESVNVEVQLCLCHFYVKDLG